MAFFRKLGLFATPMMLAAVSATAATGCEEDGPGGLGNIAEQCGLSCPVTGVAQGNFAISGSANIDAFFGSVVRLDAAAKTVTASMRAELDAIALSLGLERGAAGADIKAALEAKIAANVEGGLSINFQPPKCEVSASVTAEATAACDVEVQPGSVTAKCEGKCEAEVSASGEVSCDASAKVTCTGKAPNLACEGSCEGTCELEVGAACEGTCKGGCDGECTLKNADGSCNGTCTGECTGSCELTAGASCQGKCKGSCTYEPGGLNCEAGASASCEASAEAEANIECSGKCEGKVEPPSASAECQASAKAEAEVAAECSPPSLAVEFTLSASVEGNADARLEFEAWVEGFKGHIAALAAATAKADIVAEVAADLGVAANGAVQGSIQAIASGDGNLKTTIGAACAVEELPAAIQVAGDAASSVSAELSASAEVFGVLKS